MVPLFVWLIGLDQRHASATSLIAIVPSAVAGAVQYAVAGHLDIVVGLLIAAGGIAGSLVGTRLLKTLPLGWLRWLFIALLLVTAVRLLFEVPSRGEDIELTPGVIAGLVVLGLVMGVASGLFGIGGGVIAVPVLITLFGASDLVAKGTSLLAMIPTALTGSVANTRNGLVRPLDGIIAGVAATAASFGGVAVAFLLTPQLASILFAVLLVIAITQMVVRAIRDR
jgi:uncharacterized membrane protein YfcA